VVFRSLRRADEAGGGVARERQHGDVSIAEIVRKLPIAPITQTTQSVSSWKVFLLDLDVGAHDYEVIIRVPRRGFPQQLPIQSLVQY
jgi:hypothetical protein